MGLKVKVYFVGDRFGCWVYGFGCSLSHNSTDLDFLYLFPKKIYGFEG